MATMGVYVILNRLTGERYIGASINIEQRIRAHFSPSCSQPRLRSHLRYYGAETFTWEVLEEVEHSSRLAECEAEWIAMCDVALLYNRAIGRKDLHWRWEGRRGPLSRDERAALFRKLTGDSAA